MDLPAQGPPRDGRERTSAFLAFLLPRGPSGPPTAKEPGHDRTLAPPTLPSGRPFRARGHRPVRRRLVLGPPPAQRLVRPPAGRLPRDAQHGHSVAGRLRPSVARGAVP